MSMPGDPDGLSLVLESTQRNQKQSSLAVDSGVERVVLVVMVVTMPKERLLTQDQSTKVASRDRRFRTRSADEEWEA